MDRAIEELWSGNVVPRETCGVGNPEIERLVMLLERYKETLDGGSCKQASPALAKYIDCTDKYIVLLSRQAFHDDFCLAVRLMTAAFSCDVQ